MVSFDEREVAQQALKQAGIGSLFSDKWRKDRGAGLQIRAL